MSKMGEWRCSAKNTKAIVISSGVVAVESKDPSQIADFSLRFGEMETLIKASPRSNKYEMKKWSYYGLIRAVKENKLDQLATVFEETRTIGITPNDVKRDYQLTRYTVLPKCGGDLLKRVYKSKPRDISLIQGKEEFGETGDEYVDNLDAGEYE
jgi:hypothetical protein